MATIALKGLVFYARHGVFKEEHRLGNRFEVSVYIEIDLAPEIVHEDSIRHTVDYSDVYQIVASEMEQSRRLLETLAVSITEAILNKFTIIKSAKAEVKKYNPPINGICDHVVVEYMALRKLKE